MSPDSRTSTFYSGGPRADPESFCLVPEAELPIYFEVDFQTPGKIRHQTGDNHGTRSRKGAGEGGWLGDLLTDTKYADFTIKCRDQTYPCHKAILASRSPLLFAALMTLDRKLEGEVVLDLSRDTMEAMLEYIYSGKVTKDITGNIELIQTANLYQLTGLVDICFQCFKDDPCVDNVVDVLFLSDRNQLENFKEIVIEKILERKEILLNDETFKEKILPHPGIVKELLLRN